MSAFLGIPARDIDNRLHKGEARLRKIVAELVREYASSPDEHAEDVEIFRRLIESGG